MRPLEFDVHYFDGGEIIKGEDYQGGRLDTAGALQLLFQRVDSTSYL